MKLVDIWNLHGIVGLILMTKKISMSKEAVEWIYLWYMVQSSFAIFMQLISIVDTVKV